jgi:hypothetical protein
LNGQTINLRHCLYKYERNAKVRDSISIKTEEAVWKMVVEEYHLDSTNMTTFIRSCVSHSDTDVLVSVQHEAGSWLSIFGTVDSFTMLSLSTALTASFALVNCDLYMLVCGDPGQSVVVALLVLCLY